MENHDFGLMITVLIMVAIPSILMFWLLSADKDQREMERKKYLKK